VGELLTPAVNGILPSVPTKIEISDEGNQVACDRIKEIEGVVAIAQPQIIEKKSISTNCLHQNSWVCCIGQRSFRMSTNVTFLMKPRQPRKLRNGDRLQPHTVNKTEEEPELDSGRENRALRSEKPSQTEFHLSIGGSDYNVLKKLR
jgi:hypothetical protein